MILKLRGHSEHLDARIVPTTFHSIAMVMLSAYLMLICQHHLKFLTVAPTGNFQSAVQGSWP